MSHACLLPAFWFTIAFSIDLSLDDCLSFLTVNFACVVLSWVGIVISFHKLVVGFSFECPSVHKPTVSDLLASYSLHQTS